MLGSSPEEGQLLHVGNDSAMGRLKVLLVVGSLEMSRELGKVLDSDAGIELVAEVNNAYSARDKIIECSPDVMLLCNDLPRMSGITFLRKLMPQRQIDTLVLADAELEKQAYAAGAKAFIATDAGMDGILSENICKRLKTMADINWSLAQKHTANAGGMGSTAHADKNTVIAIGASTGGTEAMASVIRDMKKDTPGVVMVQHMPQGFTQMYAERLNNEGPLSVKEARTGDVVKPGLVLLAPGDRHMRLVKVNGMYQVECRPGAKVSGHCPSVDVLFESVAKVAGKDAIGVLMTGMGSDGAKGLLSMKRAGAQTIGQDEKTCVVYGMPKVAYELGAVDYQVPLGQIAKKLYYLVEKRI